MTRRWGASAFALTLAVSLWGFFAPAGDVPPGPVWADEVVHAGVFAALVVTGSWAGLRLVPLVAGLVVYAVAIEVVQGLLPLGRTGAVSDVVADGVGIVLGVIVAGVLSRLGP